MFWFMFMTVFSLRRGRGFPFAARRRARAAWVCSNRKTVITKLSSAAGRSVLLADFLLGLRAKLSGLARRPDRKSTRLNSSHQIISYAVFCLKKKKNTPLTCSHQIISYAVFCLKKKRAGGSVTSMMTCHAPSAYDHSPPEDRGLYW